MNKIKKELQHILQSSELDKPVKEPIIKYLKQNKKLEGKDVKYFTVREIEPFKNRAFVAVCDDEYIITGINSSFTGISKSNEKGIYLKEQKLFIK